MKISRKYHSIERRTKKAVLVRLQETDKNAVWFPNFRITLDEDEQTIACTQKLWDEKDPVADKDFKAEAREAAAKRRAHNDEMIHIDWPTKLTESGKAVRVYGAVVADNLDQASNWTFFFPLSVVDYTDKELRVPRWLLKAKAVESVYSWVSHRGRKGIDHMGGVVLKAEIGDQEIMVYQGDLANEHKKWHPHG